MIKDNKSKVWLNEIAFMRPCLLLLLVAYHSFALYCGAWDVPVGIEQNVEAYRWIAHFTCSFLMEGFIFVSGYIFTFQLLTKNKFSSLWDLTKTKAHRLLIPCLVFGLLYTLIIESLDLSVAGLYNLLSGPGHLWFLPCLFWLFLMQYLIITYSEKKNDEETKSTKKRLGIVAFLFLVTPVLSVIPFPFRFNQSLYYLLFFYGAGLFYKYSSAINNWTSIGKCLFLWVLLTISVLLLYPIMDENTESIVSASSSIARVPYILANLYMKILIAWIGVTALYTTAVIYCRTHSIGKIMLKIGACAYGAYLFHQFILKYLYYKMEFPSYTGTMMMPWVAFLITLVLATLLTLLVRSTKVGKKYL